MRLRIAQMSSHRISRMMCWRKSSTAMWEPELFQQCFSNLNVTYCGEGKECEHTRVFFKKKIVSVMTFLSNMSNWRHWMKMSSGWLYKPELRPVTIQQPSVEWTVRLQKCYMFYMLILLGVQGRITTWLIDFRIVCSGCFDPRSRAKGGGEWGENDVMSWQTNSPTQHGFGAAWENCKLFSIILSTI